MSAFITDPIFSYIFPSGVVFSGFCFFSWLIWTISAHKAKYDLNCNDVQDVKSDTKVIMNDISSLKGNVSVLHNDVSHLKSDVHYLKDDVQYLKSDMGHVKSSITQLGDRLQNLTELITASLGSLGSSQKIMQASSPLTLTNDGKKLLTELEFAKIFQENESYFTKKIALQKPKNEASLDKACSNLLFNLDNKAILSQLETNAYNNGISILLVERMCALYLRDQLKKVFFPK